MLMIITSNSAEIYHSQAPWRRRARELSPHAVLVCRRSTHSMQSLPHFPYARFLITSLNPSSDG